MRNILNISTLLVIVTLNSCYSNRDLNGYWREYNINHSDYFHSFHLTDSTILVDPVVLDGEFNKDFNGKRFYLPFNNLSEWTLDYKINGDTVFFKDTYKWVKYNYDDKQFIEDISGPLLVKVVPKLVENENEYLNYNQINSVYLHIGEPKDSYREILSRDTIGDNVKYYIQFNEDIRPPSFIPEFITNSNKLILNMDQNVSKNFIETLGLEIRKFNNEIEVYRTYTDLKNRRLVIKKIEI